MITLCGLCMSYKCRCDKPDPEPVAVCPETIPLALFPTTPPSNGVWTSDEAAASLTEAQINDGHRKILNALWRRKDGLTDEALQESTGLNPSTERPRRGELVAMGWIENSGGLRNTASGRKAIVWRLTEQAIRAAEARRVA